MKMSINVKILWLATTVMLIMAFTACEITSTPTTPVPESNIATVVAQSAFATITAESIHEPTVAPIGTSGTDPITQLASDCSEDDYDRDEWGNYPPANKNVPPRWTIISDNVKNRKITQDHHVALKDAHISGGCNWSSIEKNILASDPDNLNPTVGSFNSSKANRTPDMLTGIARGIIDTDAEKCDYATQHEDIKDEYNLSMTDDEQETVDEWLALCQ